MDKKQQIVKQKRKHVISNPPPLVVVKRKIIGIHHFLYKKVNQLTQTSAQVQPTLPLLIEPNQLMTHVKHA